MKTSELIALLQRQLHMSGDLDVFLCTGNDDAVYAVLEAEYCVTEEDEFPDSWNMPESFVKISA